LASRLMRAGLHWLPTAVLVAVVVAASSHHFHARPHVATVAFLGLTMAWLCDVESGRASVYRLAWLVPLFVLWTNVHGGVLGGMVTVAAAVQAWVWCLLLTRGRRGPLRGWRDLLVLLAIFPLILLSAQVNPYGPEMPEAWLKIMAMPLPDLIQEHRALSLSRPEGWMVAALAAVYGLLLWDALRSRGRADKSLAQHVVVWFLPLIWLVFAVQRVRHAPLFAIVAAVAMADLLPHTRFARWLAKWELFSFQGDSGGQTAGLGQKTTLARRASEGESSSILAPPSLALRASVRRRGWLLLPLLAVFAALVLQVYHVPLPVLGSGWARHDPQRWPVELLPELKSIEAERPGARVFNTLDFGGFITFHTPKLKTFIDDRCELFGGEFLSAYAEAETHRPERIDDWAAAYGFEVALVRTGSPFDRHLRCSAGWQIVRQSPAATLFRRTDFNPSQTRTD
jgi:hypothetical protein